MASLSPKRGEIWRAQLDPTLGSEQGKTRPVVVLSEPPVGRPTMRLCAPLVHWKSEHPGMAWCVELSPDAANGLTKKSSADASQTRALDVMRFGTKTGQVSARKLEAITTALVVSIGRQAVPLASSIDPTD